MKDCSKVFCLNCQTAFRNWDLMCLWGFHGKAKYLVFIAIPLDFDVSSPLTYCTLSSLVEGTPRSGVRCIPVRQRPDLGSARKCLQVNLQSDGAAAEDTVAS